MSTQLAIEPASATGHLLALPLLLFSVGVGTLLDHGLAQLPQMLLGIAAVIGGVATMLPALSAYQDRQAARREAAEDRARDRRSHLKNR